MKKTFVAVAFVLAVAISISPFWAAFSADDEARSRSSQSSDQPAAKRVEAKQPEYKREEIKRAEAKQEETRSPLFSSSAPRASAAKTLPPAQKSPPGSAIQAMGECYSKAVSDAVAAGDLKEEEVQSLNREFETLIAIRKARLDVMRAIHLLESLKENETTKQGLEAKRLLEALRGALQMEQTPYQPYPTTMPVQPLPFGRPSSNSPTFAPPKVDPLAPSHPPAR